MKANNSMKTGTLLRRFLPHYKKYRGMLFLDLLCAILSTVCELVLPMIVRQITAMATDNLAAMTASWVLRIGAAYVAMRIIDAAAQYYRATYGHFMGTEMERDLRQDLFSHLQDMSFAYYSETKVGQLMSRLTTDLFDVTELSHHGPENVLIAGVKIIASFIILAGVNFWLTLIIFLSLPIMLVFTRYYNHKMRLCFKESRHQIGEINAQVEDSLLGMRVVKSFANEDIEREKFAQSNAKFVSIKRKQYASMGAFQTMTRVFDGLMYILVVVIGALFLINKQITVADYTAYLLYVSTLLASIRLIVEFTESFQNGMSGLERFFAIMDTPPEITDAEDAKEIGSVKGELELRDVTFCYEQDGQKVLDHVSLHVNAGENVALVGPSGSGKTTMCNLIPRFYDIAGGTILIDGKDIRTLKLKSLRNAIGMVQQDVYLFSGSVKENIAYGRPGASDKDIIQAAKDAGAHDFIMQLPEGYNTFVGERGVKLSGGQKQRISIARVFLKNPPILILDEATSALDNESEQLVQQSLERLAKGRTTFTIAHRLTTIRHADTIWVLTRNGLEESGSHEELMAKDGIYSHLYKLYTTELEKQE